MKIALIYSIIINRNVSLRQKEENDMKLLKKIGLFTLSATLMIGGLSGCAADSKKSGNEKGQVLKIWGMGEEVKQLSKMTDKFTEETGIEVDIQSIPWANAHDKLLTAVASKEGPDVLQMGTTWMAEFQEAGALTDLTEYMKDSDTMNPENFFEGSVNTTLFDGKYYGVPWAAETRVLYYRTDLLADVGYPEGPKTWDELEDAAKKLTERGEGKYGISIDANEQSLGFMFARQNGSALIKDNKPLFDQPEFVEGIGFLTGLIEKGYAPKQNLGIEVNQSFSGDAILPMFISGPWMAKTINDTVPDVEGKWAVALLPAKENNISSMGGSNLTVFEHSKMKEEAVKFIEFMSRSENQIEWMKLTNALPVVTAAWDSEDFNDDFYKVLREQLDNSEPMPLIPEFEEIAQTYLKHFEQVVVGGADLQQEMDSFNEKAEALLNK